VSKRRLVGGEMLMSAGCCRRWSAETFRVLEQLWWRPEEAPGGLRELTQAISLVPTFEFWGADSDPGQIPPLYAPTVYDYHAMSRQDLERMGQGSNMLVSQYLGVFCSTSLMTAPLDPGEATASPPSRLSPSWRFPSSTPDSAPWGPGSPSERWKTLASWPANTIWWSTAAGSARGGCWVTSG
jgi:hypothetical protein